MPTALDGLYASWVRSLRARGLADATVKTYATGARQFLDWLAANAPEVQSPDEVRRADCESFLVEIVNRASASTAKTRHTGMSRFSAFLVEEEEFVRSPMEKVRPPAVPEVPVPVLTDDEIWALLKTCDRPGTPLSGASRATAALARVHLSTPSVRRAVCAS